MRNNLVMAALLIIASCPLLGCAAHPPDAPFRAEFPGIDGSNYLIGTGDSVQVFVWRSPELSAAVRVRPDGRISVPLIEDILVAGKTPLTVSHEIEGRLAEYVHEPKVTVVIQDFIGQADRQIRVVGEAAKPQAIPFRKDMTVLDVVIAAGGLTKYAAGNSAIIVRQGPEATSYRVRLSDLIYDADMSANVQVAPGDVLMIPQSRY
jgi:polysaccharide biosynthesis/export protein